MLILAGESSLNWRSLQVLQTLLLQLQDQLDVAKKNLLHAAATRPLYPTLHCIRYLLADLDLRLVRVSQGSHRSFKSGNVLKFEKRVYLVLESYLYIIIYYINLYWAPVSGGWPTGAYEPIFMLPKICLNCLIMVHF